jgi:hypothetical protein
MLLVAMVRVFSSLLSQLNAGMKTKKIALIIMAPSYYNWANLSIAKKKGGQTERAWPRTLIKGVTAAIGTVAGLGPVRVDITATRASAALVRRVK